MRFTKSLLAGALMSAVAGAASATTYTFNNNGTSTFTVDGIKLTLSAGTGSVTNNSSGLGVTRGGIEAGDMNSDAINEGKDKLIFTFDKPILLNQMTMTAWQNGNLLDQADVTYNGVTTRLPNTGPTFSFSSPIYVSTFSLTARGSGTAFRVGSLSVTGQPVAPTVPVPAAAWLMGSGLAGLAGLARRRKD